MHGFRDVVNYGGLREIVMTGYQFTWERSKGTPYCIEENLDRVLASDKWHSRFLEVSVVNEDAPPSDHSAIIVTLGHKEVHRKSRFRFENAWICAEECRALVSQCWN